MRNRDERGMDGMRQMHPARLDGATTIGNGENGPGRVHLGQNGGESGTGRESDSDPAEPRRSGRFR